MAKRRIKLALALAILAALSLAALYQSTILGWWRGEAKYQGRYTNSWRAELRTYELAMVDISSHYNDWIFYRPPSWWEQWLDRLLPSSSQSNVAQPPPLQDGDPEAIPVLVELLQSPENNVRIIAANGLERIGSPAREAIPALVAVLKEKELDVWVYQSAWQAVHTIDRTIEPEISWGYWRRSVPVTEPPP